MTGPALALRDVTVRWEPHAPPVLTRVSLAVAAGERVALLGLNGSGKTSLLLAAVGLVPHEGELEVAGLRLSAKTAPAVRERVGLLFNVPEDQLLFARPVEDVAFGLLRRGTPPADARARALLALEALDAGGVAEAPLHHLSHGQQQRVALAGALAPEPSLLLLDEPSAGLDPPGRRRLVGRLASLPAAQLVATHDLELAQRLCPRCVLLEGGRVVYDGPSLDEVRRRWV